MPDLRVQIIHQFGANRILYLPVINSQQLAVVIRYHLASHLIELQCLLPAIANQELFESPRKDLDSFCEGVDLLPDDLEDDVFRLGRM